MRSVEASCGDALVDIARQLPATHVPLQKLPQPPQWLCSLMVLKQLPSHTSGKMGGQPRGSVFRVPTEVAPADNSGDPVDGDELIEGLADLIVDDRSDVGVDVVEINSHAAGAQILKPLAFRV
jgi:hypothetical protein